jgi:histidinol phosphatase-like PHP family hydrolase
MKSLIFVFTVIFIYSCCLDESEQIRHKGNLHTHSLWSDGDDFPEMIIKWYKDHNYQFIAISDHNTIAESKFWYEIKEIDKKNKTLKKYIKTLGSG